RFDSVPSRPSKLSDFGYRNPSIWSKERFSSITSTTWSIESRPATLHPPGSPSGSEPRAVGLGSISTPSEELADTPVKRANSSATRTGPPRIDRNDQLWANKDAANRSSKAAHSDGSGASTARGGRSQIVTWAHGSWCAARWHLNAARRRALVLSAGLPAGRAA